MLTISGERKLARANNGNTSSDDATAPSSNTEGVKRQYYERQSGKFKRQFQLPKDADVNGIKAQSDEGVLKVTVPKIKSEDKSEEAKDIPVW